MIIMQGKRYVQQKKEEFCPESGRQGTEKSAGLL